MDSNPIEFLDVYERIKATDKLVTFYFTTAIENEENECSLNAISAYETAGKYIDEVFKLPVGLPEDSESIQDQWLDACAKIKKLKAAKETIEERLRVLRMQNALSVDQDAHEAVEEMEDIAVDNVLTNLSADEPQVKKRSVYCEYPVVANDMKNSIEIFKKYVSALREVLSSKESQIDLQKDEVCFEKIFQASVKLYKITKNGDVETMVGESIMTVFMCNVQADNQWHFLNGSYFLQCILSIAATTQESKTPSTPSSASPPTDVHNLSWIYPLLPSVTVCYRTDYGAFIFPDMESATNTTAFGIILSNDAAKIDEETFSDFQQLFLDLLEAILAGEIERLSPQDEREREQERPTSDVSEKISHSIINGADFIARTIIRGAEKAGEFLDRGTHTYVMSKNPSSSPATLPVSPAFSCTVGAAKKVTCVAAGTTGWIADKIGCAAQNVGAYLAPHVQAQSANLLQYGFGCDKDVAESKIKSAMTLAAGTVEGITMVFRGLEESADLLGRSLSNNSVKIISHRYGSSAGDVAADTFDTIGNTWHVSKNLKIIKPKGLAKSIFKNTGTGVVENYKTSERKKNTVTAGDLQPDLCERKKKDPSK